MPSANTGALLKRIYGEMANPLSPENSFARDIKFVAQAARTGEDFRFPVRLGLEQGATYATSHDAFTLNAAVDGVYQVASLQGAEIAFRAQLSYGEMSRLSASKGNSTKAYDQGVALKIANTTDGAELHRDMNLWYGSGTSGLTNIGVISAIAVAAAAGVVTVNISRATFIPGFWQDFQNGQVDAYTTGGTLHNTTGAMTVTGVDIARCRIQLTGAVADAAAILANDVIFFRGARAASMVGVQAITENTGSLFGISAATYPQWKAFSYAVGGTLTFDKVAEGLSTAADNGLTDGCTLYVNNRTWTDLLTDEVALRRYVNEPGDKAKPGFKEIEFILNCGPVKIKPYRYMKQGLAFAIPTHEYHRVGSTDLTFTLPGNPDEFFFKQQEAAAGAEIRCYSDQAIISSVPYHTVAFTGLSNTGDCVPS